MLKQIIDKRNYIIFLLIIILFITITILNIKSVKIKTKNYNYFGENISIEIHTNKNTDNIFKNINKIFEKYNKFYKNPNQNNNKDFIKLLKYGKSLYKKTNGYIDITSYKLLDSIKKNKPYSFKSTITSLDFKNKETLKNINIDAIIGSYTIKEIEKYLYKNKINSYIIKEDSNIIIGKNYNNQKYNIPIIKDNNIIEIITAENKSIAIKGNTKSFKPYMINPITSEKNKENKLIAVISNDINEANYIANTLYLMSQQEGKEYVKKYKVEVLWYTPNKTLKTKGFKKYNLKIKNTSS